MAQQLPTLAQLIIPSALSLLKKVRVRPEGIHIERVYEDVQIDAADVAQYRAFLEWNNPQPLCYLYLLAQRAQVALMVDKQFTMKVPGMVHMGNKLVQLAEIDFTQPFTLHSRAEVPYKEEGSLLPRFMVDIVQHGNKVAYCESWYLVKRKSKTKRQHTEPLNQDFAVAHTEEWQIPGSYGRQYARVSGDINPIHTVGLFAKMMGFKTSILHGWYSVSRLVKRAEELNGTIYRDIEVSFKAPVYLPSTQVLSLGTPTNGQVPFMLNDAKTGALALAGHLS